ncbi:hypothetical protein MNBD_ALPHA08-661 [hydrothermal vent metagenome]|uniref:FecR protein domain-containing protein n=1 Tax=hydrothermal vent metagenome TaxID=652676 RepID=A0A3B0S3J5_9ZZZZ
MTKVKKFLASLFLTGIMALTMVLSVPAFAKSHAGKAVAVAGSATSSGQQGKRTLSTGSSVFQGDTITTGFTGRVQLLFSDNAKLVVGPRSRVKIDNYVLGRGKTVSSFAIQAARGTFRFISGNSKKSAYKISIKTATIGIRGTSFDFANAGRTKVVLYTGSVQVCIGGSCQTLRNKCDLAQEAGDRIIKATTAQLVPNAYRLTFPYIRGESSLLPAFRVNAAACDADFGPSRQGNDGGSSGGSGGRGGKGSAGANG